MPPTGRQIIAGRYEVLGRLGGGFQGDVYRVRDLHEGDVVALKLARIAPSGPWVEARILRQLADPHILPIRNADLASGQPYLVTDLAQHGTLMQRLGATGSCGLDVDSVVRWTRHACHGIARAHELGLTHNDVKPANLFLNQQEECLVGDFGGASLIPAGSTATVPHVVTPETSAPEIAAGLGAATASRRSDVYSLGATAFWLLAARPSHDFAGAPDFMAKMSVVAQNAPSRLRDLAPHVPRYVAHVIERATAPNAADRYDTATQFASALGSRPAPARRWRRTDEHAPHISCWRGESTGGGSTYVVCLEHTSDPRRASITATHAASGRRITHGCRLVPLRHLPQGVRAVMQRLGT